MVSSTANASRDDIVPSRPNILWVSFEDTNPFYGCYGDTVARTPTVDRLAAEGTRYPLAFSTAGVCAPARSAVITGMYPISIGTHHMRTTHENPHVPELPTPYSALVPPHVKCFTEYLRRGKRWPYDSGIHIPMIVRWPGHIEAGEVSDQLISTIDLGPSMLSVCGVPIPRHLHGRAFLGPAATEPRQYVHASRDRHDSAYDRVRAVSDRRWKYIRHYYPHQPYVSWVPFRNAHPIMQELMRLHVRSELSDVAAQFLADQRPVEELYDCRADPHETHNLAGDPDHRETLERLRAECDRWLDDVGDFGEIPEAQMVATWYPEGVPQVPPPLVVAVTAADAGSAPIDGAAELDGPALLQMHSGIQGASIEYRLDSDPHWRIYRGPIRVRPGESHTVHVRADRIGFEPSAEVSVDVTCRPPAQAEEPL